MRKLRRPRPSPLERTGEAAKKDAEERNAAWAALAPKEQLEALDRRLGAGMGAKKQRAKIAKLMGNSR